jgi:hypothetical protein
MLVRASCPCGNQRHYRAGDLATLVGGGRDPRSVRFRCSRCDRAPSAVTVLEVDVDRIGVLKIWKPLSMPDGATVWTPERLKRG